MNQQQAHQLLTDAGAIIHGHFVGTHSKHFGVYVEKNRATRIPRIAFELCRGIAEMFADDAIDVVVGPALGGIALSQWTAYHLSQLMPHHPEVLSTFSERDEEELGEGPKGKIILRRPRFVLKRGFGREVKGKRVLAVEDTLTTGGTALQTIYAILQEGGILVGLGALVNGGNVTPKSLGITYPFKLRALLDIERTLYSEEECARYGLCAQGVPIDLEHGHGAAFVTRTRS